MSLFYEHILVTHKGPTAIITLNRPERMNAVDWRTMAELRHAIASADADEEVRAIIVTGAGKAFCAGSDLSGSGFVLDAEQQAERTRITEQLTPPSTKKFWEMSTPIIAAINGAAVGVGITMPLHFDFRIIANEAKLGFIFTRRGFAPEWNSPWILSRLAGVSRAMDLLVTGRFFTGAEAANWGIATEAVPADEVLQRAEQIAADIAANTSSIAVGLAKRLVYEGLQNPDATAMDKRTDGIFRWSTQQPDGREGPRAFMEKRPAQFPMAKNADFPDDFFE